MVKVIVNADDSGISQLVDLEIQRLIEAGLISSTTIMANMPDVTAAVNMFTKYNKRVSFGIHINLTEGHPLCYSQSLLDSGYYIEEGNAIIFNERYFDYRKLTSQMKFDIEKEMCAQVELLLDNGVILSHFDSHRHVHFHRQLIPLFCNLAHKYHIKMFRRYSNITTINTDKIRSTMWRVLMYICNPQLKTTDFFCNVSTFLKLAGEDDLLDNKIYEVMCHPGHSGRDYEEENKEMEVRIGELKKGKKIQLINYNMLNQ